MQWQKNDLVHNQRSIDEAHEEILSYTQGKDETKQRFRENHEQLQQSRSCWKKAQQDESLRLNEVDSIEQELRQLTTEIAQMKEAARLWSGTSPAKAPTGCPSSALLEETQNRLQSLNDHYSERQQNIESLKKSWEECTQLLDGIDQRTLSLENAKAGYGLKYQNQQNQLEQLQQELNRIVAVRPAAPSGSGILTEMERSLDGYYNSVKNVLSAAGQGRLKRASSAMVSQVFVAAAYALAIETVKGGALPESNHRGPGRAQKRHPPKAIMRGRAGATLPAAVGHHTAAAGSAGHRADGRLCCPRKHLALKSAALSLHRGEPAGQG